MLSYVIQYLSMTSIGHAYCTGGMAVLCVGDVQTVLLRPELRIQLFCPHPDAHLTRAIHGHQAPDAEPSFRRNPGGSRGLDWSCVAAECRVLTAVSDRLRHRQNRH